MASRRGSKNRRTLEKEQNIREAAAAAGLPVPAGMDGKPIGRESPRGLDTMRQIKDYYMGIAATEQRKGGKASQTIIDYALKIAAWMAEKIAPFETPRLSAVMVRNDDTPKDETMIVELSIGDRTETIVQSSDGKSMTIIETVEHSKTVN